jgi:hypothetical protein
MKTLNAVVGLALILYGNTVFLLSRPLGFDTPDGSYFGWFMVIEGVVFIIAGVVVAAMGLTEATKP